MPLPKPLSLAAQRGSRLQRSVTIASWWLMAQGAFYLLMGQWLSSVLNLRYQAPMRPYITLSALSLLALGLFVNRAVRESSKQYLAVDSLVLYFIGMVITTFSFRLNGGETFWFEWSSLAVNAALATALILFRTRGSEMEAPGSLVAKDAVEAVKQAKDWVNEIKPKRQSLPLTAPQASAAPLPQSIPSAALSEAAPEPDLKPKPSSEAVPHMD